MALPQQLIDSRGSFKSVEGSILDCVLSQDGKYIAFATVDGDLWLVDRQHIQEPEKWQLIQPHDGGILSLTQDITPSGFITAGDDNYLMRIIPGNEPQQLLKLSRWVEHMITYPAMNGKESILAFTTGKEVHVYQGSFDKAYAILGHDSSVSDLVFNHDGTKLATAHYNGATLWSVTEQGKKIKEHIWKGSHLVVALHPKDEAMVTSMQDNDLHGWRLSDGHNMRMSGYPTKVKSLSFSIDGKWLATSGTESVVMWPFFDGGPMGKPPVELPGIPGSCCSKVLFHPTYGDLLVAGFIDGSVLFISPDGEKVIPICLGHERDFGEITTIRFNQGGDLLCFGTDHGVIAFVDLSSAS